MAGKRRSTSAPTPSRSPRSSRSNVRQDDVSRIYRDMLAEVDIQPTTASEVRTIKRRRVGQRQNSIAREATAAPRGFDHNEAVALEAHSEVNDEISQGLDGMGSEDLALFSATTQTIYRDSDEEEEDEELFEDVIPFAYASMPDTVQDTSQDLELDLSAHSKSAQTSLTANRRKPLKKAEKEHRIDTHKIHLLCLLAHVARRNKWCNDPEVHGRLRGLLTPKMIAQLKPGSHLTDFARALSMKEGLKSVNTMFRLKFRITERGMRKALWAETEEHLHNFTLPADSEAPLDKSDFLEAAKSLRGSRDVGAQLYCALLRAAGVEARLVCSLQPLSHSSAGPYLITTQPEKKQYTTSEKNDGKILQHGSSPNISADASASPILRRRRGNPIVAASLHSEIERSRQVTPVRKKISESKHPVYWVEVLDEGHKKWQPTDPLVTGAYWTPQKFEPTWGDRENCMGYVVSFEKDGTAKDVTRRYAKAYNAKTRKMRIESVLSNGNRWWSRALQSYCHRHVRDLDRIEEEELAASEDREPMPKNIVDFKDHPLYVLQRHMRQHEVLVPNATYLGTINAGSKTGPERVYRRDDVRIARSKEKWFRLGREVRANEIPAKVIIKPSKPHGDLSTDDAQALQEGDTTGTPIYTLDQTKIYQAPPVHNGRIPKNRYGNIDLYMPSMIPDGGVHIADDYGAQAAALSGVDYARALTGFQFSGKKGTAVFHGVVVAAEYEDGVRAVVEALKDQETELEREQKCRRVLMMWKVLLTGLRIRERIWAGTDDAPNDDEHGTMINQSHEFGDGNPEMGNKSHNDHDDGKEAGGFEVDDDEHAGGFIID